MFPRSLLVASIATLLANAARAADDPTRRGFDADPSRLALSIDGGFTTETAAAAGKGAFRFAAIVDVAGGLLSLTQGGNRQDLIVNRGSLHLLGGYSFGVVEVAAHLPISLWQSTDFSLLTSQGVTGALIAPIAKTALGDLRLGAKVPLLDAGKWPLGLAALVDLRLPTGDGSAFYSDGFAVVPSIIATRMVGPIRLDGQVGYALRGQGQYAQLVVGDGVVYAVGASLDLPSRTEAPKLRALFEVNGGVPRGDSPGTARYRAPLSARVGVRAFFSRGLSAEAGVGTGLGEAGYGHERWRLFAGIRFGHDPSTPAVVGTPGDRDGDGVPDDQDLCPDEPGPAELDGCPDRDGDGIPDREDKCPDEPGPPENDGCPVKPDDLVEADAKGISLNTSIHFDTGKDVIKEDSFALLDQVARLMNAHPEFKRIRVEGHTDNVGNAAYNKDLSGRRAASVVRYLVGKGVAAKRLVAVGYGLEGPIAPNVTALGRAKNRRVVFTVIDPRAP